MTVHKSDRADQRKEYGVLLEVGLAIAIGVCILAVRVPLTTGGGDSFDIQLVEQERIEMEEIKQTKQEEMAPPPPRPSQPVEVPNDVILQEDELNFDASLYLDEPVTSLPSPPSPPEPTVTEEVVEEDEELFVIVEEMPQLIGGLGALQAAIVYPEIALRAGLEGRVFVEFIVDVDGTVTFPRVVRGIGGGCDEEALRAISEAKFTPGRQRGRAVRVKMSIPVLFRLERS